MGGGIRWGGAAGGLQYSAGWDPRLLQVSKGFCRHFLVIVKKLFTKFLVIIEKLFKKMFYCHFFLILYKIDVHVHVYIERPLAPPKFRKKDLSGAVGEGVYIRQTPFCQNGIFQSQCLNGTISFPNEL